MIALVVFGISSLLRLDTDEYPDLDQPIVFIGVAYPGASPDVVEREVVTRLEDKISGISGVDKVNSTSTDGFAQIVVQFVFSKDVNQATQDIRDAISAVRSQLPAEIIEPIIQRFDPNTLPIMSLAITSNVLTPTQLTQLADQTIGGELRSVPGVAQINIVGGDSAQRNVDVRPGDLAATGIGIDQIVSALPAQNLAAPVGNVNSAMERRSIRLQGRFERPEDFAGMILASRDGQVITLGQVADVNVGAVELKSTARFNGSQAIGLDIVKSRENATTAVDVDALAHASGLRVPAGR
ncbi:MAG: efflux RND transporter permease subunit [Gemmatimonadota bacterium]|nr:efflux RND transporter permease subunit [Gemmatimonadota bacterium]